MSAKSIAPKRLLDYNGVAAYLSVGRTLVDELVKAGEFPKVRIGTRVLFDKVDVDAYVDRVKRSA